MLSEHLIEHCQRHTANRPACIISIVLNDTFPYYSRSYIYKDTAKHNSGKRSNRPVPAVRGEGSPQATHQLVPQRQQAGPDLQGEDHRGEQSAAQRHHRGRGRPVSMRSRKHSRKNILSC